MSGIATVAVVIVWGVLCIAFIRYLKWFVLLHLTRSFMRLNVKIY